MSNIKLSIERPAEGNPRAILTGEDGTTVIFEQGGGGGGGGGAPDNAQYIVAQADATLSAERVLGGEAGVVDVSFATPGQANISIAAGGIGAAKLADDAVDMTKLANLATDKLIGRDTAGTGDPEAIGVSGGVEFDGAGSIRRSALVGDVTAAAGSGVTEIAAGAVGTPELADDSVTYAKMQQVSATDRVLGRDTAGAGDVEEITPAALRTMINVEDGATADQSAAEVPYSNSSSGLSATQVQAAIDELDGRLDALGNGMVFQGDFDAGGGAGPVNFPGSGSAQAGAFWVVTNAAGGGTTVGSSNAITVHTGDQIVARIDNASATNGANWVKLDSTDLVSAVAGKTGSVTLEPSDIANVATARLLGRTTAGTGATEQLTAAQSRTLLNVADGANNYSHPNHSGDVTSVADGAQTIAADAVTNAKLADMATARFKGRTTAGTGDPEDLTAAQAAALLPTFSQDTKGLMPGPTADDIANNRVARADGAWTDQTGGGGGAPVDAQYLVGSMNGTLSAERLLGGESGVLAVDYGTPGAATVQVSALGIGTAKIADNAVTLAKLQDIATARVLGRVTAASGDAEELTASQARTLLNVEDGAAAPPYVEGDLADGAVSLAKMANLATDRLIGRDTAGSGAPEALTVGGGLEFTGSGGIQRGALTGAVTASAGSGTTAIAAGAVGSSELADGGVTAAKLADMAQATIKGRASGAGTGDPTDLTPAQARTVLNVEDGATADQTAAEILAALITVDGAGSGLDADLLDGQSSAAFAPVSHSHAISDTTGLQAALDSKLANVVEDTTPQLGGQLDVNGAALGDGTRELLTFVEDASAVNQLEVENQATGGGPILRATGDDANVDMHLDCKGSGQVIVDATLDIQGNVTLTGTVDGRDVATDGTKLDGIEAGAQAPPYGTGDLSDGAVTYAKMQDVSATDRFLGRDTAGAGDVEEITMAAARTMLNVADGANNYVHPNHTGDVTSSGDGAQTIASNAVTTAKILDANVTLAKLANIATDRLIGRDTAASGVPEELTVGGGVEFSGSGGIQRSALTGDVTASAGSNATTIAAAAVTLAKMANLATANLIGRATAGTGAPEAVSLNSTLSMSLGSLQRAALTGDITASAGSNATTIANDAVSNAKLANVNSKTLKGRTSASSGDPEDLTMVQTMAMLFNSAIHYGCWYGGVVTLASGSDTVVAFGVEGQNSGNFSLATNVITVTNPCAALCIWYSIMIEGTVSGEAQVSVQLEQDPNSGTFAVVTGTRKDGAVDADDVDTDRCTISGFWVVAPGASYRYQITGRIQSGAATAKTVSAGSSIMFLGLSNA